MTRLSPEELKLRAAKVRLLALDVDGVLTDGRMVYGSGGEELKVFHVRDGLGIRMVMDIGIQVAIISARNSSALAARVQDLHIEHFLPARENKLAAFESLSQELRLVPGQCCFVGDDILDLPVLQKVGLAVCVADAHQLVRATAHYVTQASGGQGAVREVADLLLQSRGDLGTAVESYLTSKLGRKSAKEA